MRLSEEARRSLHDIRAFWAERSPSAAEAMERRIVRRLRQLGAFPLSGRAVPEFASANVREIIEGPFRIWYVVNSEAVIVLAVIHGARDVGA